MNAIEKNGCVLVINEYGKTVRQYHDIDYDRFMKEAQQIIARHLESRGRQATNEVRNITINLYTY